MDWIAKLKSQVEQVEVLDLQSESTEIGFEANRLKSNQVEETSGVALRVVKEGKLGFASSTDRSATDKLIRNVLESASYGDPIDIVFPGPQKGPEVLTFDDKIANLSISRLVEIGQEIIDYLKAIDADVQIDVSLERGIQNASIRNQTGVEVKFKTSPLIINTQVSRVRGDDVLMLFDRLGSTVWEDGYMALAERIGRKMKLAKQQATIQSGHMPVLFAPTGALVLGLPLMQGLDGKGVYTGISPMKGKIGEKLFDDKISVIDDGTLDGRFGSAPFDDEGVPHQRTVLIGEGTLNGFYYDLKTAAQAGTTSTGNGSRGLLTPARPSTTNMLLQNGNTPLADMISGIEEGLLVEDCLGLGQGNTISGAFSNSLSLAFKIEKGEIVGRVKDVSIAGNIYDLLQTVTAVSQESEWVYGAFNLPYILVPDMNIIAKN